MDEEKIFETEKRIAHQCPVCFSADFSTILNVSQVPILANVLWKNVEEARSVPRGDIRLVFCRHCGHVFNQLFDPSKIVYNDHYENSLHFSQRFQKYATWLANYLTSRYDLHGKNIIEIGSGKGEFLRLLCELGGNTGIGFDPSYQQDTEAMMSSVTFIQDRYSSRYRSRPADLVFSRHVLEHIDRPDAFVEDLRAAIGERENTVVFCEVPNFAYILRDTAIWDVIYEHYSYYSPQSLASLFASQGFAIHNIEDAYDSQFLFIEASIAQQGFSTPPPFDKNAVEALSQAVNAFSSRSQQKINTWKQALHLLHAGGKRCVIWGAGSKGISFLNLLNVQNEIEYIVDINPRKRNMFITGTGQQIVPPEFLKDYHPHSVIVMNPIYKDEIQHKLEQLEVNAEILLAS